MIRAASLRIAINKIVKRFTSTRLVKKKQLTIIVSLKSCKHERKRERVAVKRFI